MLIPLLYLVLVIACWTYALAFGGSVARWALVFFVLATVGSMAAITLGESFTRPGLGPWQEINWLLLLSDSSYFLGIYWIALRSRRYWPIWSSGFQLMCVLTHFGPLLDHASNPRMYRALETVWALPILITMVIGIAMDKRAERRGVSTSLSQHEPV